MTIRPFYSYFVRGAELYFSLYKKLRGTLFVTYPLRHYCDIEIHQYEMTQATAHDEKMKDLMGSEIFVPSVKDGEL